MYILVSITACMIMSAGGDGGREGKMSREGGG